MEQSIPHRPAAWPVVPFAPTSRLADAFEQAGARPAIDDDLVPRSFETREPISDTSSLLADIPHWAIIGGGAILAAILGAMLGGAMAF